MKLSGFLWSLALLSSAFVAVTVGQSNYDQVENSIDFPSPDRGLPESTVLDGKVTKLDELSPVIFLNRTKAALNCAAGFMQVRWSIKFTPKNQRIFEHIMFPFGDFWRG